MLVGLCKKITGFEKFLVLVAACLDLAVTLVVYIQTNPVNASDVDISWTKSQPITTSSNEVSFNDMSAAIYCNRGIRQQISVRGIAWPFDVCVTSGDTLSFTTYPVYGSQYGPAISFRNDKQMYPLDMGCSVDLCTYLPQTDTMIIKQHKTNNIVYGLVVYKNFRTRLSQRTDPVSGQTLGYNFDSSSPSYEFKDSNGFFWAVGSVIGSSNGRYVAVELRDKGLGLLDIDNLTMRYVTGVTHPYGRGSDPSVEFAVTDDGRFVAEMGRNAGLDIFEITDSCGENLDPNRMTRSLSLVVNPCRGASIDYGFIDNFWAARHPVFSSNGDSLSFYATSHLSSVSPHKVVLRASGYTGSKLEYLALGDSFSSGEGAIFDSEYLDGTNTGYDKCHISINSYPFIFARMSSLDMNHVKSVACSGAVIGDVVGNDDTYWGQSDRITNYTPHVDKDNKTLIQIDASKLFKPGMIHQSTFALQTKPSIITIGIGGNDVGFADKLKACLGLDTCSWAGTAMGKEQTAVELKGIYNKLVNTYTNLHNNSPDSKIYVIGYPKLFDKSGTCGPLIGHLLNTDERQYIDEAVIYLNQVIQSAAITAGVKYIDISGAFENGVICGGVYPGSMNAIRLGDDSALIDQFKWLKVIGQESFHPNLIGHAQIATIIKNTIGDPYIYEYCADGQTVCPQITLPPEPSQYLVPGIYHDYPKQVSTSFSDDNTDNLSKTITLPDYSLSPNSQIEISIASTPQLIGTFTTDSRGAFNETITLPAMLDPGYHTLHINGLSYSGGRVDLYDVFGYKIPIDEPDKSEAVGESEVVNTNVDDSELAVSIQQPKPRHDRTYVDSSKPTQPDTPTGQVKGASTAIDITKIPLIGTEKPVYTVVVIIGVGFGLLVLLLVLITRHSKHI